MRIALLAAATAAAFLPLLPAAADPIDDAIEARRGYFTLLGANIGPLAAMAKGEAEYDAGTAALHATNLAMLADYNPVPHFPEGSDNEAKWGDTRSLPAIWTDFEGFSEKLTDFQDAAKALAEVAGEGRGALGPALGELGGTCKACHDDYRAKDF